MADYSELKQNIASVIKSNNRREITGQILQNVLNQMVGSLGENYQLAGFAEPTTNPQQPDQTLFYIAEQAGVYTNFDNITLGDGLSFLMWKNSEWTSHTIGVATHSWVDSNYVSKAFLRQIFRVYDADGFEILPNDTTSIADNIKAMVGLWTNQYLSALGLGDDGQTGAQYLTQLGDVDIDSTTLTDGQVLVYDNGLWVNGQAGGVDMSVVWAALAGNTNEQINASHLTTALTGYVTSSSLSTTLADYVTTTALSTALASYASQSWVSQNYVSIAFLNRILRAYDSTDVQVQPNDTTTAIDNLKAMVGLWTEQYLSALGQGNDGGGGGYITTLGQLKDVTLTTPSVGQALVYAEVESGVYKWVNGTAGVDMSSVWTALAGNTNEQIALSHLTTALSGYVTTGGLSTTLADYVTATALSTTLVDYVTATSLSTTLASYATQQWVGQNYISIAFFNRLFAAYDSSNVIINPNDITTAVDNIKALVGLWTQQYISALGQGSDGGVVTSLANLTDVDLGSIISNNDVLTYDSLTNKWTNKPAQGGSTVAALGDLTDVGISSLADKDILQYDYTNNVWKNVTLATALSGYATTSQLSSYLPLSGGTISGGINPNADSTINLGTATAKYHYIYAHRLVRLQSIAKGDTYDSYKLDLPDKSGTIAVTSDIPSLSGYATQTWVQQQGYITSVGTRNLYAGNTYFTFNSPYNTDANLNDYYLQLTGGDLTGNVTLKADDYNETPYLQFIRTAANASSYRIYDISGQLTIQCRYNGTWRVALTLADTNNVISCGGFSVAGVGDNSYVLLAGGGYSSISSLSVGNADTLDGYHASSFATNTTRNIYAGSASFTVYAPYTTAADLNSYFLQLTGGTMTGNIIMSGEKGIALSTGSGWSNVNRMIPFSATDGITISYVNSTFYYNPVSDLLGVGGIDVNSSGLTINSGHLWLNGQVANSSTSGTTQLVFGSNGSQHVVISSNSNAIIINPSTTSTSGQIELGVNGHYSLIDGSLGVGINPAYKLHVAGDIYATGGVTSLSDIRKKDVISYELPLSVEQIAAAPTIKFLWKDKREEGEQVGTIAQYWQSVLPESIKDKSGELSMSYGVAALVSAITTARKVVDHEKRLDEQEALIREQGFRITELERECAELRNENELLKLKIA